MFERVRLLHAYGVLSYELFTAAEDLAHLVIGQAQRDRFIEFYEQLVPGRPTVEGTSSRWLMHGDIAREENAEESGFLARQL